MQTSSPSSRGVLSRALLASLYHDRRRLLLTGASVFLSALVVAILIHPMYEATSSLLVLLGSEYTYRPIAGENFSVTSALDREQILRTEVEILESQDLHRKVIREIGVGRLYPELLEPPGALAVAKSTITDAVSGLFASAGLAVAPKRAVDPVEIALVLLDSKLTLRAVKSGNAIELGFAHRDPVLAAHVLNTLEDAYLRRRRELYLIQESGLVGEQVSSLRVQLEAADSDLGRFKADKVIGNYQVRRDILLNQQGGLETDLKLATNQVVQETARLAQLDTQARSVPHDVLLSHDTEIDQRSSPLRASIELLRAREQEQQARYRPDSDVITVTHRQLMAAEADLARARRDQSTSAYHTAQNPLFLQLEQDRAKSQLELQAAKARATQDQAQLETIGAQLVSLNENEQHLGQLERARATFEDNYRSAVKVRDERRVTETVQANREANVRVLQPAVVPVQPQATRMLLLIAGIILGALAACAVALVSHFFRRVYLLPETLETDTGLCTLGCLPDSADLARADWALRPA